MNLPPELLQFLGSLIAILALAGLARWLKLGAPPKLTSASDAQNAAGEVRDGYTPKEIAIDANGNSAVMLDEIGQIMVLKRHGNKFAGRILDPIASAAINERNLTIHSGEQRYGQVTLELEDPQIWADRINKIGLPKDA